MLVLGPTGSTAAFDLTELLIFFFFLNGHVKRLTNGMDSVLMVEDSN